MKRPLNYETPRRGKLGTRDVVSIALVMFAATGAILIGTFMVLSKRGIGFGQP